MVGDLVPTKGHKSVSSQAVIRSAITPWTRDVVTVPSPFQRLPAEQVRNRAEGKSTIQALLIGGGEPYVRPAIEWDYWWNGRAGGRLRCVAIDGRSRKTSLSQYTFGRDCVRSNRSTPNRKEFGHLA